MALKIKCKTCKDVKPFRDKDGKVQFNSDYICKPCETKGNQYAQRTTNTK